MGDHPVDEQFEPAADGSPVASAPGPSELPIGRSGRGRELTRRRSTRAKLPDTGRRHHIGAAPTELAVLGEAGPVRLTRTAPIQLADQTNSQLAALADQLEREMLEAASTLDFERAAYLREDAASARSELSRRGDG